MKSLISKSKAFIAASGVSIMGFAGPAVARAAIDSGNCSGSLDSLKDLFDLALCFINVYIVPLLFAVAIAFFLYGVVRFIRNADNEGEREKGQQFMIWSIVALFVMVSVWGLVNVLGNTFDFDTAKPTIPQL